MKNLPQSPVTGKSKTKLVGQILSSDIVSLYKLQENTDVQKYFPDDFVYILECEETGYRFYYPFELAGDAEFYQNLRNSEYDRDEAEDHKFAYQHINQNDKLLEIGCGTGKF
ncbi:MAG: hypothetical protein MUC29_11540, partial [Pyrinomonadaceae bacterium]|nr:hypothetical protein [Pyrinomonadaceae bacterium]